MPKKKSFAINYVSFSDTKTEVIEERKSIARRRKTKLIEKDVFFKRNIPKANKYKPGFKLDKKEFQLFDDIFNGKVKIESLQPKLKEKTKLSKKSNEKSESTQPQTSKLRAVKKDVKKIPESYEELIERLSDGFLLLNDFNTKPEPSNTCPVKKEVEKCPESHETKLDAVKKEVEKCPESHETKLRAVKKNVKKCPESHEAKVCSIKKEVKKCPESYEELVERLSEGFLMLNDFSSENGDKCVPPMSKKEVKMKASVDEKSTESKGTKEESTLLRGKKKDSRNAPPKSYLKLIEDMSNGVFLIKKREDQKKVKKAKKEKEQEKKLEEKKPVKEEVKVEKIIKLPDAYEKLVEKISIGLIDNLDI
jgi:N6-adenosine-specific RNA methylase IME4